MAETVTLLKAHFEALLRRAEFYSANSQPFETHNPEHVSVSRTEYDSLQQAAKEYVTLRNALIGGGVASESLDILIHGESPQPPRKDSAFAHGPGWTEPPKVGPSTAQYPPHELYNHDHLPVSASAGASKDSRAFSGQESLRVPQQEMTWQQKNNFWRPLSPLSIDDPCDYTAGTEYDQAQETSFPRRGQRTLLITGLSERITCKDLTDVIRGGRILYITIRPDRTATVFMLEGATEFIAHVKRHDLYVKDKRLEVKWNDHQFMLSPYVGRKIAAGASRNLVLRNAAHIVKVADIRHHMEHIHKFDIIDIQVRGRDVFVYTNSVHNALFARTCMISRKPYKGLSIQFFPDECTAPLPTVQRFSATRPLSQPVKKQASGNLFQMLSLDSNDSDEENQPHKRIDDDDNTIDGEGSDYDNSGVSLSPN